MAKRTDTDPSVDSALDIDQLRADVERAAEDPSTPAYIGALMRMMLLTVATLLHRIALLEKQLFGRKSERLPRKKEAQGPPKRAKRQQRRIHSDDLPEEDVILDLPDDDKVCSLCGGTHFEHLGYGDSFVIELIPARLLRYRYRRQKCVCANGCTILQAAAAPRVGDASG